MTEESSLVGRFPFAMVLAVNFLLGLMFVLLSGPLISLLSMGERYEDLGAVYSRGYPKVLSAIATVNAQAVSVSLLLGASFVLGHLASVLDRGGAWLVGEVGNWLRRVGRTRTAREAHARRYFTAREMARDDYAGFLGWLMSERTRHAHWEWELHLYYLRWGTFTQVFLYFGFLLWLLKWTFTWTWLIAFASACGLLLFVAIEGSAVMQRVHTHYRDLETAASKDGGNGADERLKGRHAG